MSDNLLMLLEMIEEVLEEQKQDQILYMVRNAIGEENIEKAEEKKKNQFRIQLKKGAEPRTKYAEIIGNLLRQRFSDSEFTIEPNLSDGKLEIGQKIKIGRKILFAYALKDRPGGRSKSERFEENVIYVLNGNKDSEYTKERLTPKEQPNINNIATKVAAAVPGGSAPWIKPQNAETTYLYSFTIENDGELKKRQRVDGTPKTDISDKSEDFRLSLKRNGAQLLSAQSNEINSITNVVGNQLGYADKVKKDLVQLINSMGDKIAIDELDAAARGKLGREIAEKLFFEDAFKQKFLFEAMTGNNRFTDSLPKANCLLVWNMKGAAHFHPSIEKWTKENFSIVKFGVRSRGKGRGLGARLEPYMKELEKSSGGPINERPMQVNPNIQRITSMPPASTPKEYPEQVIVAAIETIFANFNEDFAFLQALDLVGIDPALQEDIEIPTGLPTEGT